MTSSHRHGTSRLASAGDVDATLAALATQLAALDARVKALETPDSPWREVFSDEFATWDPSRYFVYPDTWTNKYTGKYDPTIISSDGNKLRIHIHTDATGTPRIAAFCPIPAGSLSGRGDLPSMAVEFRLRADKMAGYKGVPLLWPMSGDWPHDGEIDGPEGSFAVTPPKAFVHHQDATVGNDQDWFAYPAGTSWQDWHTYRTEWLSGERVSYFMDGVLVGTTTTRIPNTPMHLVMQFETNLTMTKPDPAVAGYVEIDWLKVWVPA